MHEVTLLTNIVTAQVVASLENHRMPGLVGHTRMISQLVEVGKCGTYVLGWQSIRKDLDHA